MSLSAKFSNATFYTVYANISFSSRVC